MREIQSKEGFETLRIITVNSDIGIDYGDKGAFIIPLEGKGKFVFGESSFEPGDPGFRLEHNRGCHVFGPIVFLEIS